MNAFHSGRWEYDGLNRLVDCTIARFVREDGVTGPASDEYLRRDYYYNESWQVLEERRAPDEENALPATTPKYQYVWDLRYVDALLLRDENKGTETGVDACIGTGDQRLNYLQDANFNTVAVMDATTGAIQERYAYSSYGQPSYYDGSWTVLNRSAYDTSVLFAGYRLDAVTRVYHVRNRWYHPLLGRWISRDPLSYVDGMSLYEYVSWRPHVGLDPTGQSVQTIDRSLPLNGWTIGSVSKTFGYINYTIYVECEEGKEKGWSDGSLTGWVTAGGKTSVGDIGAYYELKITDIPSWEDCKTDTNCPGKQFTFQIRVRVAKRIGFILSYTSTPFDFKTEPVKCPCRKK